MADEIKVELDGKEIGKTVVDETTSTDESLKTEEQTQEVGNKIPYDRFKAKVDEANALKEKLAKIEQEKEEAKRKELEEQNEYKQLYEEAQEQIKNMQAEVLNAKKDALLVEAGYPQEQSEMLRKLVEGDSDEEIKESIELIKEAFPVQEKKYVDPSVNNGAKDKPESIDGEDVGRNMFESLLKSGRIKGFKK